MVHFSSWYFAIFTVILLRGFTLSVKQHNSASVILCYWVVCMCRWHQITWSQCLPLCSQVWMYTCEQNRTCPLIHLPSHSVLTIIGSATWGGMQCIVLNVGYIQIHPTLTTMKGGIKWFYNYTATPVLAKSVHSDWLIKITFHLHKCIVSFLLVFCGDIKVKSCSVLTFVER